MKELIAKLQNHATLVAQGIDSDSALRATFGEDVLKETDHLQEEIKQLDQKFNN